MKDKLTQIRVDLEAALEMVGNDNGISFDIGRITYSQDSFRVQLNAFEAIEGQSAKEVEFRKWAVIYGLEPDDFGKTINLHRGEYVISGIAPKSRKYPILGTKSSDGKTYKLITADVKRALANGVTNED